MSIYVQIATIEDFGITDTVISALNNASNPQDIHIGIAATVTDKFYNDIVVPLTELTSVKAKLFDPIKDRGLGRGRVNSRFAYDNEDFVLQIDAHTNFDSGWDTALVSTFNAAILETNNPKTLVTGYLGKFYFENGSPVVTDSYAGYSVWPHGNVTPQVNLKSVSVTKICDFPDSILGNKTKEFYPSNRVAGNFIFGNKEWAAFHGWSGEEVFWEEEITPAITLLDNGFSLVFPNIPLPLTHLYWGDDLTRQTMDDIFEDPNDIDLAANEYIAKFVRENAAACNKYKNYAGYDLATNSLTYKVFVPEKYGF